MTTIVRELTPAEFPLAEQVWTHYRGQKADPKTERIFGAFVDGKLAATARCTRHPDGLEMDCVFALDEYRGQGLARKVVEALLAACGKEKIYIHSTLVLRQFYDPGPVHLLLRGDGGVQRDTDGAGREVKTPGYLLNTLSGT